MVRSVLCPPGEASFEGRPVRVPTVPLSPHAMARFSKYRPSSTLRELQANANQVFERLFRSREDGRSSPSEVLVLHTDVLETGEGYRVRAELPGVDRKDIKINATEKRLTIRGRSHPASAREDRQQPDAAKTPNRHFCRSIALPRRINPGGMKAVFKSEILIIDLPKSDGNRKERTGWE